MRALGFALGVVLLVLGAAAGVAQLLALLVQPAGGVVSIGSIWGGASPNTLVGFQALVENRLAPALWAPIQTYFIWPAWLTLGVPGLALALLCRPRRRTFD